MRCCPLQGNVREFLGALEAMMSSGAHFKQVQGRLEAQIMAQVEAGTVLRMLALSLKRTAVATARGAPSAAAPPVTPMVHLLLELAPDAASRAGQPGLAAVRGEVAGLLLAACTPANARVAAKIALNFAVDEAQLEAASGLPALQDFTAELLEDPATFTPAVSLLLAFPTIRAQFDLLSVLDDIAGANQVNVAVKLAEPLGPELRCGCVAACLHHDRLKEAASLVRKWGLKQEFPDTERQYKVRSMGKLMDRQLWDVAVSFAGEDAEMQRGLLRRMVTEGESALAEAHRQQWGLPKELLEIDPAVLAAEEERERNTYLQLDVPPEAVHFVSTPEQVAYAVEQLKDAAVVGLDTEWRCVHEVGKKSSSPVALLQLGTGSEVFLIDMLALSGSQALDDGLAAVMSSPDTTIVGFEIAGDLRVVAASYPHMRAFKEVASVVELQVMWRLRERLPRSKTFGLSALAEAVLGKPLNKSMQTSNWEKRPLTARQTRYAALDAHVCVRLLQSLLAAGDADEALSAATFDYPNATRKKARKAAQPSAKCDDTGDSGRGPPEDGPPDGGGGPSSGRSSPGRSGAAWPWAPAAQRSAEATSDGAEAPEPPEASSACESAGMGSVITAQLREVINAHAIGCPLDGGAAQGSVPRVWAALCALGVPHALRLIHAASEGNLLTTAGDAAAQLRLPQDRIVKTMAVLVDGTQPWLLLAAGSLRLDFKKASSCVAPSGTLHNLSMASPEQLRSLLGYEPGTVPPIGYRPQPPCLVDAGLLALDAGARDGAQPLLYCGAGTAGCALALTPRALLAATAGRAVDLAQDPAGPAPPSAGGSALPDADQMTRKQALPPPCGSGAPFRPFAHTIRSRQVRFLCDTMLGRLCRRLRVLGCDASVVEDRLSRKQVVEAAVAAQGDGAVFLTRCHKTANHRHLASVFWLPTDDAQDQLSAITDHFGIKLDSGAVMSRCSRCGSAALGKIDHDEAAASEEVPERMLDIVQDFWQCSECRKVFWVGPKSQSAMTMIRRVFNLSLE
eukprot:jgi/Tetstr1/447622/TSEL_034983.t1